MAVGIIEIVEDNAVKIDGAFYHIGGNVKVEFLRPGKCEYSVEDDGETVTFVKMDKSERQRTFGKIKPKSTSNNDSQFRDPSEIIRQECLTAATAVSITNYSFKNAKKPENDNSIKATEVISIAKEFEKYVTDNEAKPE